MNKVNRRFLFIISCIFSFLSISIIVYYSSRNGEQTYQDSLIITQIVADITFGDEITITEFSAIHNKVRLSAHIGLYLFLGTVAGLWINLGQSKQLRLVLFFALAVVCIAVSFADEWFKQYIPGRHFHLIEFYINAVSALIGISICSLLDMLYRRIKK